MIDFNNIQRGIVRAINVLVGKDACPDRQILTSPAIVAKQKGPIPDFPVAVVDKLGSGQYGISSVSDEYYDENNNLVRETRYKTSFTISVHGGVDDDVLMIAQVIRDTFFREYGRLELQKQTEAGLLAISSPSFAFNYLNTDYEEIARITIDFSVTDVFVEDDAATCPATGEITSIIVNGELYENEDDADPLPTQSTAP